MKKGYLLSNKLTPWWAHGTKILQYKKYVVAKD